MRCGLCSRDVIGAEQITNSQHLNPTSFADLFGMIQRPLVSLGIRIDENVTNAYVVHSQHIIDSLSYPWILQCGFWAYFLLKKFLGARALPTTGEPREMPCVRDVLDLAQLP